MIWKPLLRLSLVFPVFLAGAGVASAQEVSNDRFQLSPLRIHYGVGSVRLEGMGGFLIAVADENNEINLNDFSGNPAGFGDDRESWVLESRYSHREFSQPRLRERDSLGNWVDVPVPVGVQDLRAREAVLGFGKYEPRNFGAGVQVNMSTAKALANGELALQPRPLDLPVFEEFDVFSFKAVINKYLSRSFTVGALVDFNSESSVSHTPDYYDVDHDASGVRGGFGVAWHVLEGVVLGGKGELVSNSIAGTSEDGNHLDEFEWDRPISVVSAHVLVDRGRLNLGVDFTEKDVSGFEKVTTSWSSRFIDNPGDEGISQKLDVFSEDRNATRLQARGMYGVTDAIQVSGLFVDQEVDFSVTSIPNVRGSLEGQDVLQTSETFALGVGWRILDDRLLLAGEFVSETNELEVALPDARLDIRNSTLDVSTWRVGGEYFLSKSMLVRAGIMNEGETLEVKDYPRGADPEVMDTREYTTTRLALGLGLLPKGGIVQVDIGFDTVLSSDSKQGHTNVGGYVKYLF